jgi:hypothetical protein
VRPTVGDDDSVRLDGRVEMKTRRRGSLVALAGTAVVVATLAPFAAADAVYHTEHLSLTPVGGAPLQSGFVQNIKANGPQVYARERFVLIGAMPGTTYTVTRNFFVFDPPGPDPSANPGCGGTADDMSPVGTITTNSAGNGTDSILVRPEAVSLVGDHGVRWTVTDASGSLRYETVCTKVSLD